MRRYAKNKVPTRKLLAAIDRAQRQEQDSALLELEEIELFFERHAVHGRNQLQNVQDVRLDLACTVFLEVRRHES